ncbi:MAG: hypothetical protein HUJ61_08720 [Bacilli bacterium]|nr:hypothetical protein [Bacilli bacterium]
MHGINCAAGTEVGDNLCKPVGVVVGDFDNVKVFVVADVIKGGTVHNYHWGVDLQKPHLADDKCRGKSGDKTDLRTFVI